MVHARTHVYFYYPGVQVFIDHEVVPNHLEKPFLACYTPLAGLYTPHDDIFNLLLDVPPVFLPDVVAKCLHVPHAIVDDCLLMILLNGVIGEMHEFVLNVVETIVVATEPEVALFVEPNNWRIIVLDEYPLPDIELLAVDEKGVLDILLDDKLAVLSEAVVGNIIQVIHAFDPSPSGKNLISVNIQLGLAIHTFLNPLIDS